MAKMQRPGSTLAEGERRICNNCTEPVTNDGPRVGIIHTNQLYCCFPAQTSKSHLVAE